MKLIKVFLFYIAICTKSYLGKVEYISIDYFFMWIRSLLEPILHFTVVYNVLYNYKLVILIIYLNTW